MATHTNRSTLAACVATVIGVPTADVPLGDDELRAWLAQLGMGMVPVADAASFAWAGPWIARRPALDDGGPRAVVMFGVPSGPIWDPAATTDEVIDGVVITPLDVSVWHPPSARDPGTGVVEAIAVAPDREAPVQTLTEAEALAGNGLAGDRYAAGKGTFASGRPGSALTLVDADVLDDLAAAAGHAIDHRRNVVVRGADLNALVGRAFHVGDVACTGSRLCEPCLHLDRLNGGGVLRPLVHRGGLRADIVGGGVIRAGDRVVADDG